MSSCSLTACIISVEKVTIVLWGASCINFLFFCFQYSLFLTFDNLLCLNVVLFGLNLFGILWASWIWTSVLFPSLRYFQPFLLWIYFVFCLSSGVPIMWILFLFIMFHKSYRLYSLFFILLPVWSSDWIISCVLLSRSLILSSAWLSLILKCFT